MINAQDIFSNKLTNIYVTVAKKCATYYRNKIHIPFALQKEYYEALYNYTDYLDEVGIDKLKGSYT